MCVPSNGAPGPRDCQNRIQLEHLKLFKYIQIYTCIYIYVSICICLYIFVYICIRLYTCIYWCCLVFVFFVFCIYLWMGGSRDSSLGVHPDIGIYPHFRMRVVYLNAQGQKIKKGLGQIAHPSHRNHSFSVDDEIGSYPMAWGHARWHWEFPLPSHISHDILSSTA